MIAVVAVVAAACGAAAGTPTGSLWPLTGPGPASAADGWLADGFPGGVAEGLDEMPAAVDDTEVGADIETDVVGPFAVPHGFDRVGHDVELGDCIWG